MDTPILITVPGSESGNSEDTPVEDFAGVSFGISNEEFVKRVDVVKNAIKEDPEKVYQCLAEIHSYLSIFEENLREFQQEMVVSGGPLKFMRAMFGMMRGNRNDE